MGGESLKSFDEIYREEAKTVYWFVYSYVGEHNLAEELTQETFYRAIKSINNYNGKCKISVWLCQIAKHIMFQQFEKDNKYKCTTLEENREAILESLEVGIINSESKKEIYKAINQLDIISKEVVLLRLTGELSFKDIGEILGKSENWARVKYFRAKSKIGRRLEDDR